MSWGGQHADSAYRGPDRRGADRTPPDLGWDDPRGRNWGRAALVAPLAAVCATLAATAAAQGLDNVSEIYGSLHLCWVFVTLVAGIGLYLRWRMTGEAAVALLAAALVVMSFPQLPLAVIDAATDPESVLLRVGPMTRLTVTIPTGWLLWRCIRTPEVDSTLRPVRLAVTYSVAASGVAVGLSVGQVYGVVAPLPSTVIAVVDIAVALLAFACAWAFVRQARSLSRRVTAQVAVVFLGLGLAALVRLAARGWWSPLFLLAAFITLVSLLLMVLLTASLLRSVLKFNGLRLLSLSLRADSAEERVRREQDRMHELRATIAGIREASGTLRRYDQRLDPGRKQNLQQMMSAELERLERLLSDDDQSTQPGPVMLDDVIRPLVVRQREQGATVHWRPTGACALIRSDEVAEILNILLTNARQHAPGVPVEVVVEDLRDVVRVIVRDTGPGVPAELGPRIFDRGAHCSGSTGQGLGLHIAQRLAADGGGTLSLVNPAAGGAEFVLTVRGVSDPTSAGMPYVTPVEDAG